MKFFGLSHSFGWPAWVPIWARVFPWLWCVGPMLGVLCGLVAYLTIFFSTVNHPVDEFKLPFAMEPRTVVLGLASVAAVMAEFGFREGAGARFHVGRHDGRPLHELDQEYASAMGCVEAIKSLFRWKAVLISMSAISITIINVANPLLWYQAFGQGIVSTAFEGTTRIHFSPNIFSDETFSNEFEFAHPAMKAWQAMDAQEDIHFPGDVCAHCTIVAQGFGWDAKCFPDEEGNKYDFSGTPVENATFPLFSIDVSESRGLEGHTLGFKAFFKPAFGCAGHYKIQRCFLSPAIVNYYLHVVGKSTKYERGKTLRTFPTTLHHVMSNPLTFGFIHFPDPAHAALVNRIANDERMQVFAKVARGHFETELAASHHGGWWSLGDPENDMKFDFRTSGAAGYWERSGTTKAHVSDPCFMKFQSPIFNIVEFMHELAARTSVITAIEANATTQVDYFGSEQATTWLGTSTKSRVCLTLGIITSLLQVFNLMFIWWRAWVLDKPWTMRLAGLLALCGRQAAEAAQGQGVQLEGDGSGAERDRQADNGGEEQDEE